MSPTLGTSVKMCYCILRERTPRWIKIIMCSKMLQHNKHSFVTNVFSMYFLGQF